MPYSWISKTKRSCPLYFISPKGVKSIFFSNVHDHFNFVVLISTQLSAIWKRGGGLLWWFPKYRRRPYYGCKPVEDCQIINKQIPRNLKTRALRLPVFYYCIEMAGFQYHVHTVTSNCHSFTHYFLAVTAHNNVTDTRNQSYKAGSDTITHRRYLYNIKRGNHWTD